MLPEVGFAEFLVLAIVALVVVGPRDLPKLMRMVGGAVNKVRGLAQDFRRSFDDMGREMELEELRREIDALKHGNPVAEVRRELSDLERDARAALTPAPAPATTDRVPDQAPPDPPAAETPALAEIPPAAEIKVGQARVSTQA